jgi:hypoxanthine phosphoribosyltransferase
VLLKREQVERRVKELGAEITLDYQGRTPVVIGVLTGAFMFVADLVRAIDLPVEVDFVRASSYGAARVSSGSVQLTPPTALDWVSDRDVIFAEDILETGETLKAVHELARTHGARTVRTAVLLRKPVDAPILAERIEPEYVGFDIERRFVVGYGLDDDGKWRHLPYVGTVD